MRVFVHASMKFRADRIVSVYGEREDTPEKRLKDKDKKRAAYYDYYTDMRFEMAEIIIFLLTPAHWVSTSVLIFWQMLSR